MQAANVPKRADSWERIVDYSLRHQDEKIEVSKRSHKAPVSSPRGTARSTADVSSTSKQNINQCLEQFLAREASDISHDLRLNPSDKVAIQSEIDQIFDNIKIEHHKPVRGEDIAKAHIAAQKALIKLRNQYSKTNNVEIRCFVEKEIFLGVELELGPRICVIEKAPKIQNLVLSGGGMKGQGYVPVVRTLQTTGISKDLKHIAGTSAGALTAACIATGMQAEAYSELAETLDMMKEMGKAGTKSTGPSPAPASNTVGQNGAPIRQVKSKLRFSADKLLRTCQETLRSNVKNFSKPHLDKLRQSELSEVEKASIRNLHNRVAEIPGYQITFADLALLHKYDPDNFKELTLTGFNKTDQTLEVFDAASWPDLPIATAMRISMAIPGIIDPVILQKNGQDKIMVDGGVSANLPTHLLNPYATGGPAEQSGDKDKAAISFGTTMALSFDSKGQAQRVLDRGADSVRMPWYKRLFATVFAPSKLKAFHDDTQRFAEAGIALPVHHRDLDTLSFGASKKTIRAAHLDAEARFLDALRRNGVADHDRATHRIYKSPEEAVSAIDDKDLRTYVESQRNITDVNAEFFRLAKEHIAALDGKPANGSKDAASAAS